LPAQLLWRYLVKKMTIREATINDTDAIWEIFEHVVKLGDTYAFDPDTPKADLPKYWFAPGMKSFVAEEGGNIIGSYFIKPNQPGLGNHIANCGYMVHPDARGKGVGGKLCSHSIAVAPVLGYKGIQFNLVVSTNTGAKRIWEQHGFKVIGTIPKGFKHKQLGFVDAYIMFLEIL